MAAGAAHLILASAAAAAAAECTSNPEIPPLPSFPPPFRRRLVLDLERHPIADQKLTVFVEAPPELARLLPEASFTLKAVVLPPLLLPKSATSCGASFIA